LLANTSTRVTAAGCPIASQSNWARNILREQRLRAADVCDVEFIGSHFHQSCGCGLPIASQSNWAQNTLHEQQLRAAGCCATDFAGTYFRQSQ